MKQGDIAAVGILSSVVLYVIMTLLASIALLIFPSIGESYIGSMALSNILISVPAILVPGLLVIGRKPRRHFGIRGTSISNVFLSIIFAIGIFLVSTGLNALTSTFAEQLGANPDVYSQNLQGAEGFSGFLLLTLFLAVFPAVCEEFLFRGALINSWRSYGRRNAILISTVLFALMHCTPVSLPSFLIIGYFLGALAFELRSVVPSMIVHFINNFITVCILCFSVNNPDSIFSAAETAEASQGTAETIVFGIIIMLIGAAIMIPTWKKLKKNAALNVINDDSTQYADLTTYDEAPSNTFKICVIAAGAILVVINIMMLLLSFFG